MQNKLGRGEQRRGSGFPVPYGWQANGVLPGSCRVGLV